MSGSSAYRSGNLHDIFFLHSHSCLVEPFGIVLLQFRRQLFYLKSARNRAVASMNRPRPNRRTAQYETVWNRASFAARSKRLVRRFKQIGLFDSTNSCNQHSFRFIAAYFIASTNLAQFLPDSKFSAKMYCNGYLSNPFRIPKAYRVREQEEKPIRFRVFRAGAFRAAPAPAPDDSIGIPTGAVPDPP